MKAKRTYGDVVETFTALLALLAVTLCLHFGMLQKLSEVEEAPVAELKSCTLHDAEDGHEHTDTSGHPYRSENVFVHQQLPSKTGVQPAVYWHSGVGQLFLLNYPGKAAFSKLTTLIPLKRRILYRCLRI